MNEQKDPIERELEQALAVDPSPDLQARIRRRVAGIPVRPKRPLWFAPALGLAAAAAVVVTVISLRPQPPPPSTTAVVNTTGMEPVAQVTVKPPVRVIRTASEARSAHVPRRPVVVVIRSPILSTPADAVTVAMEPMELAPVQKLELKMNPLPEMAVLPMARFDTFSIEPFNLKAQEPGVNE